MVSKWLPAKNVNYWNHSKQRFPNVFKTPKPHSLLAGRPWSTQNESTEYRGVDGRGKKTWRLFGRESDFNRSSSKLVYTGRRVLASWHNAKTIDGIARNRWHESPSTSSRISRSDLLPRNNPRGIHGSRMVRFNNRRHCFAKQSPPLPATAIALG